MPELGWVDIDPDMNIEKLELQAKMLGDYGPLLEIEDPEPGRYKLVKVEGENDG
jgi:hypothetical protein